MNHILIIAGIIFLLAGIIFRYLIIHRKLNKSSESQLKKVTNEKAIKERVAEEINKLIAWILILIGAFLIMIHWTFKSKKNIEETYQSGPLTYFSNIKSK